MTPPTQQSDVDESIERLEYRYLDDGLITSDYKQFIVDIKSLITEIHRLRSERGIAVEILKNISRMDTSVDGYSNAIALGTAKIIASQTLEKLGENHE